jgi:hypothetical protein
VCDEGAITDANVDDLFLVTGLGEYSAPGKRRSANGRDYLENTDTYIGSTTSE